VAERLLEKGADIEAKDKVHSYATAPTIFHPLPADCLRACTAAPIHLKPCSQRTHNFRFQPTLFDLAGGLAHHRRSLN
jgi:hypothetical protein